MNRLWVRLSVTIAGLLGLIVMLPIIAFLLLVSTDIIDPIPAINENNFTTLSEAERADRILNGLARGALQITVISGLVGVGTGILVSRVISAPISDLAEAAQAIGARKLNVRVQEDGTREIEELARSFNEMASALEHSELLRQNLMADVAHELRTPLTVLEGNLRAVIDQVYELDQEDVANLYEQTRHLIRLVNDLHELAQAEAQQLPLNITETDLGQLVAETTAVFAPVAAEKEVEIVTELPVEPIASVPADGYRLRQILHNLLSNALRHTPDSGQVTVTLTQNPQSVVVAIRDSGAGIAPEHVPHIFDRFYRVDASRTRDTGGTGLGLAIVKALVEAHGGQVTAVSHGLGHGSTFSFSLPIAS